MSDERPSETLTGRWFGANGPLLDPDAFSQDSPDFASDADRESVAREFRRLQIPSVDAHDTGETVDLQTGLRDRAKSVLKADDEPIPGYRIRAVVGRGGSGEVWKAVGPGGFAVALKFVWLGHEVEAQGSGSPASRSSSRQANLRSLELMRDLRHPCLLPLFGAWHRDGQLIIGMELAEGTLLDRYREEAEGGATGIPRAELIEFMQQSARGIDFLNEPRHCLMGHPRIGIAHCDIKPHNLLLVGGSVKVADFGLARMLDSSSVNIGSLTPAYAAPEMISGKLSSRSDQYALAVSYCQLASGRLPYTGSHWEIMMGHRQGVPDLSMLPEAERPVVGRALAKLPEERWPDCRSFVRALAESGTIEAGAVVESAPSPQSSPPPAGSPNIKKAAALSIGFIACAGLLVGTSRREVAEGAGPAAGTARIVEFAKAIPESAAPTPRAARWPEIASAVAWVEHSRGWTRRGLGRHRRRPGGLGRSAQRPRATVVEPSRSARRDVGTGRGRVEVE